MGISRCMCTSESQDSLSVVIHERKAIFSPLKDVSAEQKRILTGVVMFKESLGVGGRLCWPSLASQTPIRLCRGKGGLVTPRATCFTSGIQ